MVIYMGARYLILKSNPLGFHFNRWQIWRWCQNRRHKHRQLLACETILRRRGSSIRFDGIGKLLDAFRACHKSDNSHFLLLGVDKIETLFAVFSKASVRLVSAKTDCVTVKNIEIESALGGAFFNLAPNVVFVSDLERKPDKFVKFCHKLNGLKFTVLGRSK